MARSEISRTRVVVRESYYWPDQQLNIWIIVMLATGGTLIGIFANFVIVQGQLGGLGIPWIMPYSITVGSLLVIFILIILGLVFQRRLIPGVVILGSFILLVLFIAGLVGTAIQLFGPQSNINGNCQQFVFGQPLRQLDIPTLAWLEQNSICQSWLVAFAFWIVGAVFLVYMIVIASTVARGGYGEP